MYYVADVMGDWHKTLKQAKEAVCALPRWRRKRLDGEMIYGAYTCLREVFSETPITVAPDGTPSFGKTRRLIVWKREIND